MQILLFFLTNACAFYILVANNNGKIKFCGPPCATIMLYLLRTVDPFLSQTSSFKDYPRLPCQPIFGESLKSFNIWRLQCLKRFLNSSSKIKDKVCVGLWYYANSNDSPRGIFSQDDIAIIVHNALVCARLIQEKGPDIFKSNKQRILFLMTSHFFF